MKDTRRTYRLGRRGEAAEETRRRIVAATHALHQEQRISQTTMRQIADRAGVSIGSVYHHFPTYEDAVRACGAYTIEKTPLPTAEIFAGLATPARRVERLAAAMFDFYERLGVLERVRSDQDAVPVLRHFVAEEERQRTELVAQALGTQSTEGRRVRTVAAVLDVAVYNALVRAGLSTREAGQEIAGVINAWLPSATRRSTRLRMRSA